MRLPIRALADHLGRLERTNQLKYARKYAITQAYLPAFTACSPTSPSESIYRRMDCPRRHSAGREASTAEAHVELVEQMSCTSAGHLCWYVQTTKPRLYIV